MKPGPLMLDLVGTTLMPDERKLIQHPNVGGLIFFARNFESKAQLMDLVSEIKALRPSLLLAVDQEGGRVQRLQEGFTKIPPMQAFGRFYEERPSEALELAKECAWLMAAEVLACGIDFSFAPVLDVDDEHCKVIANRAFSPKPESVAALGKAFIAGMREAGMASTGKHFPGHGNVEGDSHLELPVDPREFVEVMAHDGASFNALMPDGMDAVMPAHILFPKVDSQPVGFSSHWLKKVLRTQLGFQGVIFSDDLSMAGALGAGTYSQRAALALEAGCDMVLACNNREGALEVLSWLEANEPEPSDRLSSMLANKTLSWSELECSERWLTVVPKLKVLSERYLASTINGKEKESL